MRLSLRNTFMAAVAVTALGTVQTTSAQLLNAGFEIKCGPAVDWTTFGNVSSINFFTVTGTKAIKMFGPFNAPTGFSGIQQSSQACTPGQQWKASAFATNPVWDALSPTGSVAYVAIDFLSADKTVFYPGTTSPELSGPIEPAVLLESAFVTAPAGAAWVQITLLLRQQNFIGGAVWWDDVSLTELTLGSVTVPNFSFEDQLPGCNDSSAQNWTNFGNGQQNFGENVRTGSYAAKLFGGFNGDPAFSGWFQNVPAVPGSKWKTSGYGNSASFDLISAGNDVFLVTEFHDEFGGNLGSSTNSASVPTGASNSLAYEFYETTVGTAPEGTAFARAVILQIQSGFAGGATWWDDMSLTQLCPSDFDGDGFVTGDDFDSYVFAFEAGDASSDFDGDGFVTGDDFDAYVLAFEAGC